MNIQINLFYHCVYSFVFLVQCATKDDREPPSQAELFIETRKSKKGKELDQETSDTVVREFATHDLIILSPS